MIHILQSKKVNKKTRKKEFYFIEVNDQNGKTVGDSAESHPSRQRANSNIASKMAAYNSLRVSVVDHTLRAGIFVKTYDLVETFDGEKIKYVQKNVVWAPMKKSWKKFEK